MTNLFLKIQSCPWSPFKLNEIATLEKCFREVSIHNSRVSLIGQKLSEEAVFVEPSDKLKHLARNSEDKRADSKLMSQVIRLQDEISSLNEEIEYYEDKLIDLSNTQSDTSLQVCHLKKEILMVEQTSDIWLKEFELNLERVSELFETSIEAVKTKIPDFIQSLPECNMIKQFVNLPSLQKRYLIKLAKSKDDYSQQQQQQLLSFRVKKAIINQLCDYFIEATSLFRDLTLISKVYSTEIPEVMTYLDLLKTHIEYLEKPLKVAPKKVTVIYHDLSSTELPQLTAGLPELIQDIEFSRLFEMLAAKLKISYVDNTTNN